jgi:hypothetical protein
MPSSPVLPTCQCGEPFRRNLRIPSSQPPPRCCKGPLSTHPEPNIPHGGSVCEQSRRLCGRKAIPRKQLPHHLGLEFLSDTGHRQWQCSRACPDRPESPDICAIQMEYLLTRTFKRSSHDSLERDFPDHKREESKDQHSKRDHRRGQAGGAAAGRAGADGKRARNGDTARKQRTPPTIARAGQRGRAVRWCSCEELPTWLRAHRSKG